MNSKYIWISCFCRNYYKTILKIHRLKIDIYASNYNDNLLNIKIKTQDLNKIKKHLPSIKIKVEQKTGIDKIKGYFNRYYYFLISIFLGLLILFFLSNIVIDVRVVHSKKEIRNLIYNALEEEGIGNLSWRKNYNELTQIKNNIIKKYQDKIEWMEIESVGMRYIVRVEERIITRESKTSSFCNIVASKNGVITDIRTKKGEAKVTRGTYVRKGDVLISGSITLNNEIKTDVCADGVIKAEVWYIVNVSMPLHYSSVKKTGKKRLNIMIDNGINSYYLLRPRLREFKSQKIKLIRLPIFNIFLTKDEEISKINKKYNPDEALEQAIMLAVSKISIQKKDKDKIITQKVLKKEVNDSKINLEMFFSVEEEIGVIN